MNVSEMYPRRFLNGASLAKPVLVSIVGITRDRLRPAPAKPEVDVFLLAFSAVDVSGRRVAIPGVEVDGNGHYHAVMRAALARAIATIVGTEDTDQWPGRHAVLYGEAMTVAGKPCIALRARAPRTQPQQPQQQPDPVPEGNGKMTVAAAIPATTVRTA